MTYLGLSVSFCILKPKISTCVSIVYTADDITVIQCLNTHC